MFARERHRLPAVHGRQHAEVAALEPPAQRIAARFVVFHQQNRQHRRIQVIALRITPAAINGSALRSTISTGSRTANRDPSPGRLSTDTVPPIRSQKRDTMARPSPVPPYLRVVVTSACVKGSNTFRDLFLRHARRRCR